MTVLPPRAGLQRQVYQVWLNERTLGTQGQASTKKVLVGTIRGALRQTSAVEADQMHAKWPTSTALVETRSTCTALHPGHWLTNRGRRYDVLGVDNVNLEGRKYIIGVRELAIVQSCNG